MEKYYDFLETLTEIEEISVDNYAEYLVDAYSELSKEEADKIVLKWNELFDS